MYINTRTQRCSADIPFEIKLVAQSPFLLSLSLPAENHEESGDKVYVCLVQVCVSEWEEKIWVPLL